MPTVVVPYEQGLCVTPIGQPILSQDPCPFKENLAYWQYFKKSILQSKIWDYVPVKFDKKSGYYRYDDISKFYEGFAVITDGVPISGSGDCLQYHRWEDDQNPDQIIRSPCKNLPKTCFYEISYEDTVCAAYESICNPPSPVGLDTNCYCYSKYTEGFFCR